MNAEERWASQLEWAQERGEIEIKIVIEADPLDVCAVSRCCLMAFKEYEVGLVTSQTGAHIPLCADHDDPDMAYQVYEESQT